MPKLLYTDFSHDNNNGVPWIYFARVNSSLTAAIAVLPKGRILP